MLKGRNTSFRRVRPPSRAPYFKRHSNSCALGSTGTTSECPLDIRHRSFPIIIGYLGCFAEAFREKYFHKKNCQKNPRVRKIRVRNSGAGNGCANFMDTWKKCVLSAGKPMSIKFSVFKGGFGGGGGSADFIFMGARIFLNLFTLNF